MNERWVEWKPRSGDPSCDPRYGFRGKIEKPPTLTSLILCLEFHFLVKRKWCFRPQCHNCEQNYKGSGPINDRDRNVASNIHDMCGSVMGCVTVTAMKPTDVGSWPNLTLEVLSVVFTLSLLQYMYGATWGRFEMPSCGTVLWEWCMSCWVTLCVSSARGTDFHTLGSVSHWRSHWLWANESQ